MAVVVYPFDIHWSIVFYAELDFDQTQFLANMGEVVLLRCRR